MKVLVIGGYGAFGARIVKRLKRIKNLEVLTGGRNTFKADVVLDIKKGDSLIKQFCELKPHLVIHTAGPFNSTEDYAVARACLAASNTGHKCNYLDLADDSDYVMGFGALDAEARQKGCLLVTGASTTPAITTSVISHHCPTFFSSSSPHPSAPKRNSISDNFPLVHFTALHTIDINLSVANSSMPGEGTVQSVLRYCGLPIRSIQGGKEQEVFGWKTLTTRKFPGMLSSRWCSDVLVPDVGIFTAHISPPPHRPQHMFPKVISTTQNALRDFRFRAGVESSVSMLGLSLLASMKKWRLLPASLSLADLSAPLLQLNRVMNSLPSPGGGQGGMTVSLTGPGRTLAGLEVMGNLRWGLSANADTGPEIPCTPALIIANKLNQLHKYRNAQVSSSSVLDAHYRPGARVCADMISLHDFTDAIQVDELDIQQYVSCITESTTGSATASSAASSAASAPAVSPTFTALDLVSQSMLPVAVSAVHARGGVVSGELLVTMSRLPLVRLAGTLVGLPTPPWLSQHLTVKVLVNMEKHKWTRLFVPVDKTVGKPSVVSVFSSSFTSQSDDQLLTESTLGGLLQFSMQQKAVTQLREGPTRQSLGERPWIYNGFEGVCVKASLLNGLLPLPSWLGPRCLTSPHEDGLGWDLVVSMTLPLLGEVVRYEGPLRVAAVEEGGSRLLEGGDRRLLEAELAEAARRASGVEKPSSLLQKTLGKYVLVYDSQCVICDATVNSLIDKDANDLLMFSSTHDKKSRQLLSELGMSESTFASLKDSTIFLVTPFGDVLTHSDALVGLLRALPGVAPATLGMLLGTVPRRVRDCVYDYVATNRHSLLGGEREGRGAAASGEEESCTVLGARASAERAKFL